MRLRCWIVLPAAAAGLILAAPSAGMAEEPGPARTDYLTFAQGAVPLSIGGDGATMGANFEHAVKVIDGDVKNFVVVTKGKGTDQTATEFVYELPALTTFDRFAVPEVLETPSPSQTFTRVVEVHGSATGADTGYELLAAATLATHGEKGEVTELALAKAMPVKWVKLRLVGGIELTRGEGFLEFSEIIGNGTQDPAPASDRFAGVWKKGANAIELSQNGAVVSGCYYPAGDLHGTVTGNILRATGVSRSDQSPSLFILSVTPDGQLRGVQSANGAPFRLLATPPAPPGTDAGCQTVEAKLGCGSIIHGINFDFDSAVIRPDAEPVLAALHDGLSADAGASIVIEGHTSSEGSDAYNQALSQSRAQSVVDDLIRRGIAASRLKAAGAGETRPIADNADENGRAMNRRVEVVCS
jgi:outer membrane protein OmpA-like peptidoglycan-associated protein